MDQTQTFNHLAHPSNEHAARALTLQIRGLRAGERIVLDNGKMVRSIATRSGPHLQRKFVVIPKGASSDARHRAVVLGQASYKTATEAAIKALER